MKHFHLLPWVIVALLILAAFILRFVLWGYSFSALVCCCLAGIIAFYEITGMLLPVYPAVVPILRRIFTGCLAVGIAVVTVTEGIIIKASFGSPEEPIEYLVVLGAKVRTTGPSASLWDRIYGAYDYLTEHPDVDFVQLQINYADWENPAVQSRANYEVARRHGKQVVIMEPVKGGR